MSLTATKSAQLCDVSFIYLLMLNISIYFQYFVFILNAM